MFIIMGLLIIIVLWAMIVRKNLIFHFNLTQRSWLDITKFELKKVRILEDLESKLQKYAKFEPHTITQIITLRQQIMNLNVQLPDMSQLQYVEELNEDVMHKLNIINANYAELKDNLKYLKMIDEIEHQNNNVCSALKIFNRNVDNFNRKLQIFPNNIMNFLTLSQKPIQPFSRPLTHQNFYYRPHF